jgi:hypothetical protein
VFATLAVVGRAREDEAIVGLTAMSHRKAKTDSKAEKAAAKEPSNRKETAANELPKTEAIEISFDHCPTVVFPYNYLISLVTKSEWYFHYFNKQVRVLFPLLTNVFSTVRGSLSLWLKRS